ncbi:MAG: SRPBCC domain-containing protein, partial [Candidatus Diapherotrites archaeon]|nr:SRPBCC domain-containing protein [Candidatus Diapherotrites archaeon]
MKTKTIKQIIEFQAGPHEVFEALMDSKKHSAFTSSKCRIGMETGEKFSAYDGYIYGENLEIVADKKIVQSWTCTDWPLGHFSKATFEVKKTKNGARLSFTQTGVPEDFFEEISQGWHEHYW